MRSYPRNNHFHELRPTLVEIGKVKFDRHKVGSAPEGGLMNRPSSCSLTQLELVWPPIRGLATLDVLE